jgi:uncharacterized membrane protein
MSPAPSRGRVASIDVVRGIVMILMALDHTRDYFGVTAISPTSLAQTTVPLFFTRWITHICAPVFFLLTGTSAALTLDRRTVPELSRLLVTRGLWLIALELTAVRCFGYQFNVDYRVTLLVVLWALGWSMVALSALVRLPTSAVAAIGVTMIATHNLLDSIRPASFGVLAPVWTMLHVQAPVLATPRFTVFVAYPLIPWIGVTAAGYVLGRFYRQSDDLRRRRLLLALGSGLAAAFVVLRWANVYGDPVPWSTQRSPVFTALSFLNTTKYPPSLLFLLMTLGPAALLLWMVDERTPRVLHPAAVIGKVPLFYFVLHLTLIHLLAVIVCIVGYGSAHWMFESPRLDQYPITAPPGWGYSLPVVYAVWAVVVVMLYPVCRWFAGVKQRRKAWWLSYL